jgi:DNA processing protein
MLRAESEVIGVSNEVTAPETEQAVWRVALTRIPGIGVASTKKLIAIFGDAACVFRASGNALRSAGISLESVQAIQNFDTLEELKAELQWLSRNRIRLLYFTDPEYPQRLLSIGDAPPLLYYRGNADLNAQKIVAVVGTRSADNYGKQTARQLIAQLQLVSPLIISGLALGIDAAAHEAALESKLSTVGVLGHGLGTIYPSNHTTLSAKMARSGGLLTSFAYNVKTERFNFPIRNAVVAGLCDALVVVQTGLKGGSLITVGLAQKYHKKIFAVPGRLWDVRSEGCNRLIQQGTAHLLSSGEQLAAEMGWSWPAGGVGSQASLTFETVENGDGRSAVAGGSQLLQLIREKDCPDIDELVTCSHLDASAVALLLLQLELRGQVTVLPGKRYMLTGGG